MNCEARDWRIWLSDAADRQDLSGEAEIETEDGLLLCALGLKLSYEKPQEQSWLLTSAGSVYFNRLEPNCDPPMCAKQLDSEAGKGIKVGILDTGLDVTHVEFEGKEIGLCAVPNDLGPRVTSCNTDSDFDPKMWRDELGHGTHIAGLICGRNVGMAPCVELAVVDAFPHGAMVFDVTIVRGLNWLLSRGCQIINVSLGRPETDSMALAFEKAALRGVHIFASAGNGPPEMSPASYETVTAVQNHLADSEGLVSCVPNGFANVSGSSQACAVATAHFCEISQH